MPDLPGISGREAIRAFLKAGFVEVRVSGGHHILKKEGHRYHLSVPNHRSLKKPLLRGLIKASGLSEQAFVDLL